MLAQVRRGPLDARRRAAELHRDTGEADSARGGVIDFHSHLPVTHLRVVEDLPEIVDRARRKPRRRETGDPLVTTPRLQTRLDLLNELRTARDSPLV